MRAWLLAVLLLTGAAHAAEPGLAPPSGARLSLGEVFRDETGRPMTIGQALGGLPAVLVFADWTCRALCGTTLGLAAMALPETGLRPGADYRLVAIGLDPHDGPQEAAAMKAAHLDDDPALAMAAPFLSGDAAAVRSATAALGFHAVHDRDQDQFAHPAALLVLAPDGRLAQVLPAFGLEPDALRTALQAAAAGRSGGILAQVLLICHQALAAKGPGAWVLDTLMGGGVVTVLALASWLLLLRRREGQG